MRQLITTMAASDPVYSVKLTRRKKNLSTNPTDPV